MFFSVVFFCAEGSNDACDLTAQNVKPVQVKKEEETEEQPAAKRKRGQSKSQTKTEVMPKEEIKGEGSSDLIFDTFRNGNVMLLSNWRSTRWSNCSKIIK